MSETPATGFCSYCNRGRLWAFLMQISDPLDIRRRVKLFSLWWYRIPLGNGSARVARHKNVGLEKGRVSFCMWYRGEEHQAPVGARGVEGVCGGGGMLHDYPCGSPSFPGWLQSLEWRSLWGSIYMYNFSVPAELDKRETTSSKSPTTLPIN